jgi:hypothetical protein
MVFTAFKYLQVSTSTQKYHEVSTSTQKYHQVSTRTQKYPPRAIAETKPFKVTEIHLWGWSFPTNIFPYAPVRDRTLDQMVKGLKYLPLVPHFPLKFDVFSFL